MHIKNLSDCHKLYTGVNSRLNMVDTDFINDQFSGISRNKFGTNTIQILKKGEL
jgi:hypothetical protein